MQKQEYICVYVYVVFPDGVSSREPAWQCRGHLETQVRSLDRQDLEEGMATHSSILAWRIPLTEEPDRLQSIGLRRVRHN